MTKAQAIKWSQALRNNEYVMIPDCMRLGLINRIEYSITKGVFHIEFMTDEDCISSNIYTHEELADIIEAVWVWMVLE